MRLTIENVRRFAGLHQLKIRPITLVVGDNSSGKTTLLASLAAASELAFPNGDIFNQPPFELGSFDTIATYRGGKYGRASHFCVGLVINEADNSSVTATFVSFQGVPKLDKVCVTHKDIRVIGTNGASEWEVSYKSKAGTNVVVPFKIEAPRPGRLYYFGDIPSRYFFALKPPEKRESAEARETFEQLRNAFSFFSSGLSGARALAPLRTRPRRTYDELIQEETPEGVHVPLMLSRVLGRDSNNAKLENSINEFGHESGLFEKLTVKRLGKRPSDPFQIRVKSTGPDSNLIDVGYGVSQALPIIVDSLQEERRRQIMLIQQPEVHLHPKAQAALGSFFCDQAKGGKKSFVIETHSDFLIDRVRMCVAEGKMPAASVGIAYLERDGIGAHIHDLELDDQGNILNAPASYRDFFLEEESRLLFRGG